MARPKQRDNRKLDLTLPDGPIQWKYADFRDNFDFVGNLFISPYAGGKSSSMVDCILKTAVEYPGCRLLLVGATLTALKKSTIPKLQERVGVAIHSENQNEGVYRFPPDNDPRTGETVQSELRCMGVDRNDIEDVMKSTEWFRVFIEEANTVPSDAHDVVLARARQFAFHRSLKVHHYIKEKAELWGVHPDEAYDICRNGEGHPIKQFDLEMDDPMPGSNGVKAVMNPHGNDHVWMRYVGLPFPDGGVTEKWANENIGIREFYFTHDEREEVGVPLIVGNLVMVKGTRGYIRKVDGDTVTLMDGKEFKARDVELIMQLYTIYGFSWENKSRNYANHQNALLMMNRGLRKRTFAGIVDNRLGLVFPNFIPRDASEGGHIFQKPQELPGGLMAIGGIDVGGNHSTSAVLAFVTRETRTVVIFGEYLKSGVSSAQAAYDIQAMVPPEIGNVRWMMDPSAWRKTYAEDLTESHAQKYIDAGFDLHRADRGDEAFDRVADMLEFRDGFVGSGSKARLYVMDNCEMVIEAMRQVTWRDIQHGRHKWIVDMADSIKYMVSGTATMDGDIDIEVPSGGLVYSNTFAR